MRELNGFEPEQAPPGFAGWCKARGDEGLTVFDIATGYGRRFINDPTIKSKTRSIAVFMKRCWQNRVWHIQAPGPDPDSPAPPPPAPVDPELEIPL